MSRLMMPLSSRLCWCVDVDVDPILVVLSLLWCLVAPVSRFKLFVLVARVGLIGASLGALWR